MMQLDAVVIGGGILGCFAARSLMRWNIKAALVEAADDVCTGITRANSAIVYPGYDMKPGSLKAALTCRGSLDFPRLCRELEVPLNQCGSVMVGRGEGSREALEKKYDRGRENGVPGLEMLTREQVLKREPMVTGDITGGLYAPTAATVNPMVLGIAAFENAAANGCIPLLRTAVEAMEQVPGGYILKTQREEIFARAVLNCAGLNADKVQELLFPPSVRLFIDGADYLVLDADVPGPSHIIFTETPDGKGITAIPAPEGNLMIASAARPLDGPGASPEGLRALKRAMTDLLPGTPDRVIRNFSALRPNPCQVALVDGQWVPTKKSIHSFVIEFPAPGFCSLIGIKTPGITCAGELGEHLAGKMAAYLNAAENPAFRPRRRAIVRAHDLPFEQRRALAAENGDYGEVVCLCRDITCAEVKQAIARGAKTVDAVKRRLGTAMGPCQGSRCTRRIQEILGVDP
ncbi:MAG: FAD-dependent oxidoreductase [Eubacteriales bacterium]|nr:FAD-dependent oxidoreductase [Eubacteriales bacterium]